MEIMSSTQRARLMITSKPFADPLDTGRGVIESQWRYALSGDAKTTFTALHES